MDFRSKRTRAQDNVVDLALGIILENLRLSALNQHRLDTTYEKDEAGKLTTTPKRHLLSQIYLHKTDELFVVLTLHRHHNAEPDTLWDVDLSLMVADYLTKRQLERLLPKLHNFVASQGHLFVVEFGPSLGDRIEFKFQARIGSIKELDPVATMS